MKPKNFIRPLIIALALLLIPFLAMTFNWQMIDPGSSSTDGVNWSPGDFILMGTIIYIAGLFYEFFTNRSSSAAYKAGAGLAVLTGFLIVWVTLAVGIIGDENPANLFYFVVILIGLVGAFGANLQPKGMMRAALATAVAQMAVPVIAVIFFSSSDFSPGIVPVFGTNAALALMWITSALLFKSAADGTKMQVA